jgi:hypothetical protein
MQKSTEQALNFPLTRTNIFGDNASDEDEVEHDRVETGTDGKKREIQRVRLSKKEKIEIALH